MAMEGYNEKSLVMDRIFYQQNEAFIPKKPSFSCTGALTLRTLKLRFPFTLPFLGKFRKITAKNTTKIGN